MTEALMSLRHLTIACGDFAPVAKGARYPGDDEDDYIAQGTPYLVKARHRAAGGQKWGVVRAFSTTEQVQYAVDSLRALHFITEYMVIDLRDRQAARAAVIPFLDEEVDEFQPAEVPPIGQFSQSVWTKVFPGAPASTA